MTTLDTGTGYGRPAPQHDARLTEVGPGTPMGEALRRYWHPVASSSQVTSDLPKRAKILGEDLILFRTKSGKAGAVFERCAHRGSSLFYGRIEDDGIRCCYHGWKFDTEGNCLEQPAEPGGGRRLEVARQPWYPVEERYGLMFVYMGPPDRKPDLPRYDFLEELEEGEELFSAVPGFDGLITECNWLQAFENAIDPIHAAWLHSQHSGFQFANVDGVGFPKSYFDPKIIKVAYAKTGLGAMYTQSFERPNEDGTVSELDWCVEVGLPNMIVLPDFTNLRVDQKHDCMIWVVPLDDFRHQGFVVVRSKSIDRLLAIVTGITQGGKQFFELTDEDKQRYPGDFEAQVSQGDITQHSEETLATSDKGVVMLRRMLKQIVDDVEAGRDPANVTRGENPILSVTSGVFTRAVRPANATAEPEPAASVS